MYLSIGGDMAVRDRAVIGIFDLDNTTCAKTTRELLHRADEKKLAFVTLEVRASNAPAIALYEKNGFQSVGVRKNYYSAPTEDGVLMTNYR